MSGRSLALALGASIGAILIGYQLLRPRTPTVAPARPPAQPAAAGDTPSPAVPAAAIAPTAPAPPAPTLPELARGGAIPAGDPRPVERALAERSPGELELGGQLARAGLEAPPEMAELFRRWQRGDPAPELRRFVVDRFPRDLKLRALTLDWLERHPRP